MKILEKIEKNTQEKNKEISKILDIKKSYNIDFLKNNKTKLMGLYENKKLVIAGEYNFYGIYQPYTKLWIWASSIPGIDSKHIKYIKKLKESDYLFEGSTEDKMNFYYQLLTQDVIHITDEIMLEWINELLIYLSEDLYFFNPTNSEGNVQFLTLIKIKEKYI